MSDRTPFRQTARHLAWLTLTVLLAVSPMGRQRAIAQAGHASTLGYATASVVSPTRLVVTMVATGDLPGLVTLTIDRDPATHAVTSGTWSLVVAYAKDVAVAAASGNSAPGDDPDGGMGIDLVNRGTLAGTLAGGTLQFDAAGAFTGFTSSQLLVNHGSVEFAGAAGGGSISATGTGTATSGTLALNF